MLEEDGKHRTHLKHFICKEMIAFALLLIACFLTDLPPHSPITSIIL